MKFLNNELYKKELEYLMGLDLPWGMFKDKSVIVTGANGMIGKCIIDVLMAKNIGVKIVAIDDDEQKAMERFSGYIDSDNFKFLKTKLNEHLEEMGRAEFVIHTSLKKETNYLKPIEIITNKINGTNNILEYAVNHGNIRFVFISSLADHDEKIAEFKENDLSYFNCNTLKELYFESKCASEGLCQAYIKQKELDAVIIRLAKVYGPNSYLKRFIKNGLEKKELFLSNKGEEIYPYLYLTDAIAAILTILLKGECKKIYNVLDEESVLSLNDFVKIVANYVSEKEVFKANEKLKSTSESKIVFDSKRLKELGWKPHYNITSGIKKSIDILNVCEK